MTCRSSCTMLLSSSSRFIASSLYRRPAGADFLARQATLVADDVIALLAFDLRIEPADLRNPR